MADAPASFTNDLFRQFLIERGYQQTLKTFENETKDDRKRGIRVSAVVEKLRHAVLYSDIQQMNETWKFLETNIFKWLEASKLQAATTFKHELFRWYLVTAAQNRRTDKVTEFFDILAPELQRSSDWSDWFVFPYLKVPQENPKFSMYFQRTWVELYQLSLKNFLMLALNSSAYPQIVQQLSAMLKHMQYLDNENKVLRQKLTEGGHEVPEASSMAVLSPLEAKEPRPIARERLDDVDEDFSFAKNDDESSRKSEPNSTMTNAQSSTSLDSKAGASARSGLVSSVMRKFSKGPNSSGNSNATPSLSSSVPSNSASGSVGPKRSVGARPNAFLVGNRLTGHPNEEEEISGSGEGENGAEWCLQGGATVSKQQTYSEHRSMINHCRFNPNGQIVASLELEGAVKFWAVSPNLNTIATLTARSTFLGLDWVPKCQDRILLSTKTGQVRLYDLTQKTYVKETTVVAENNLHPRVHLVKCSPKGDKFILGAMSHQSTALAQRSPDQSPQQASQRRGRLAVWDLATMRAEGELTVGPEDSAPANTCAIKADDELVLVGCADGYLRVYDLKNWTLVKQVHGHQNAECLSVLLSSDSRCCYSLGTDGRLAAWTLPDLRPITSPPPPALHSGIAGPFELIRVGGFKQVLHVPRGQIIALGADNRSILTCAGSSVKIYDVNRSGGEGVSVTCGHRAPVVSLDWHWTSNNITVLSACMEGSIVASSINCNWS